MKLSIIIPCYNAEKFLDILFENLLSQNLDDCEVIFINDGSQDETENIIKSFIKGRDFFYLISTENCGVSSARNKGIAAADGEYIAFLDCDDIYVDSGINIIKNNIDSTADILAFGFIKNGLKQTIIADKNSSGDFDGNTFMHLFLMRKVHFWVGSFICKKSFINNFNLRFDENLQIGEDFDFYFRAISVADRVEYCPSPVFIYNINNASVMQGYSLYSYKVFLSFVSNYTNAYNFALKAPSFQNDCNFYIVNSFVSQLWCYLCSSTRDKVINSSFAQYAKVLKLSVRCDLKRKLLFLLLRYIPLSLLFMIFRKRDLLSWKNKFCGLKRTKILSK